MPVVSIRLLRYESRSSCGFMVDAEEKETEKEKKEKKEEEEE